MIKKIIKARYRVLTTKKENIPDWVSERREICNECPLNSRNTNPVKRNFKWYRNSILNNFKNFCTECGCGIKPKTFSEIEGCPKGKWKPLF